MVHRATEIEKAPIGQASAETDAPKKKRSRRVMCEDCGKYPADLPSRICPGCDAYREHTGAF